jgi:hypothetical protein
MEDLDYPKKRKINKYNEIWLWLWNDSEKKKHNINVLYFSNSKRRHFSEFN